MRQKHDANMPKQVTHKELYPEMANILFFSISLPVLAEVGTLGFFCG